MNSVHENYREGVKKLISLISENPSLLKECSTVQLRLEENLKVLQQFGDSESLRHDRIVILDRLNSICLEHLGQPFLELCEDQSLIWTSYPKEYIQEFEDTTMFKKDCYIPLTGTHEDKRDLGIVDNFLDEWIRGQGGNLTILGDYGTGKTTVVKRFVWRQLKMYLKNPKSERLPIYVNLRKYNKAIDIEAMMTNLLINHYGFRLSGFRDFKHLNSAGNFVLVLDGFDEMATRIDYSVTLQNLQEIDSLVVSKGKTILTCRTHYFKNQDEICHVHSGTELYNYMDGKQGYQFVFLNPFSEDDYKTYLQKWFPREWKKYYDTIETTYNLKELAKKPILLEMIVQTLPKLQQKGKDLNVFELYQTYTSYWLDRDDWRSKMNHADREYFSRELAFYLCTMDFKEINYAKLPEIIKAKFPQLQKYSDLEYFEHDVRTCTFLNRDNRGNYAFVHKSFMEFFVATKLHLSLLGNNIEDWNKFMLTNEICFFLKELIQRAEKDKIISELRKWLGLEGQVDFARDKVKIATRNAAVILHQLGLNLVGANLEHANLEAVDFSSANLQKANLTNSNMHRTLLNGANLENANMERAILTEAKLNEATLFRANIKGTDFRRSDLTNTRLELAIIDSRTLFDEAIKSAFIDEKTINKILDQAKIIELKSIFEGINIDYYPSEIVGTSAAMKKIIKAVELLADSTSTVLITGETGTGKALVANKIHMMDTTKRNYSFMRVNCAALSENLLEDELFGYEKGSLRRAISRKKGLFEVVQKGTVFLDEIGEMSISLQAKLLRVLQDFRFKRQGGEEDIELGARIISSTNRDLHKSIEEGIFREDLYYRLCVCNIHIPPLRERGEDILVLSNYFLTKFSKESGKPIKEISAKAKKLLTDYEWPGNVRELRNTVERAVILCEDSVLDDDLFHYIKT